MGQPLSYIFELGTLATGIYGATRGWHAQLTDELNRASDGRLDDIVRNTPQRLRPFVQSALDIAPYTIALYTTIGVGSHIMSLF